MLTEPWVEAAEAVAVALGSDPSAGISAVEAARRLDRFGANRLDVRTAVPRWRKLLAQYTAAPTTTTQNAVPFPDPMRQHRATVVPEGYVRRLSRCPC